jgi:PUA domain protein
MRYLSKKEKKELQAKLPKGYQIDKKDEIKEENNIIYKDEQKYLIKEKNAYLPHLQSIDDTKYRAVYIDKGAIPFILKGADLMRPGITKIDDNIQKDEIILIKDENHNKNLAIGYALNNSDNIKKQEKGKSIKIYHFFKDANY